MQSISHIFFYEIPGAGTSVMIQNLRKKPTTTAARMHKPCKSVLARES